MVAHIFSFITWALCALGIAYWGMAWFSSPLHAPAHTVSVGFSGMPKADPLRLLSLSEQAAAPQESSVSQSAINQRVQLVGLMAGTPSNTQAGIALLVVDGKPAKAFRLGQSIDGELEVLAITRQGVTIGAAGDIAGVVLAAQALPAPNTGILPPIDSNGGAIQSAQENTPAPIFSGPSGSRRNPSFGHSPDIPPGSTF